VARPAAFDGFGMEFLKQGLSLADPT
jgi:hypothetical protein